jgi:hypothetical protein
MSKDLSKLIKHSTDAIVSVEDSSGNPTTSQISAFPFVHLGLIEDDSLKATVGKNEVREAGGSNVQLSEDVEIKISGMEIDPTEVDVLGNFEKAERTSLFLFGPQQSHKISNLGLTIELEADLSAKGKSRVNTSMRKFKKSLSDFDLGRTPTYFNTLQPYQYLQAVKAIRQDNLVFEFLAYLGYFNDDTIVYDSSKYRRSAARGGTWGSAPNANYKKLAFDGVDDFIDFGDILDDDGQSDILFEVWIKILAADAASVQALGKKDIVSDSGLGWRLIRDSSNNLRLNYGDGTNTASGGAENVLQNVWTHFACSVDRNGNIVGYKNGVVGTSTSINSVGNANSVSPFYIGRQQTQYANFEIGAIRFYNFGAGRLPSDIAAIIARHYNAEKSIFGL